MAESSDPNREAIRPQDEPQNAGESEGGAVGIGPRAVGRVDVEIEGEIAPSEKAVLRGHVRGDGEVGAEPGARELGEPISNAFCTRPVETISNARALYRSRFSST